MGVALSATRVMKLLLSILSALALLSNCTSQVGGGNQDPVFDASPPDATPLPDALPPGFRDGERCLVTPEDATGGCAEGYACTVVGGGLSSCRQICPMLNFSCSGYNGPGYSLCILTYTDAQGMDGNLCSIICGDENETLNGCADGACDGTCPEGWTCQNDPVNAGLKRCE